MKKRFTIKILLTLLFITTFLISKGQVVQDFTTNVVSNGCEIATYEFMDISTVGGVPIDPATTYFTWSFGNGNGVVRSLGTTSLGGSGFANIPRATYGSPGLYTVRMTIDFGTAGVPGTPYTITHQIIVYEGSSPDFTASQTVGCAPLTTTFTDITDVSAVTVGNPVAWTWNFGDGNTSNQQNPTHTYINPGTYQVTLTVYTSAGGGTPCSGTIIKAGYIYVQHTPTADFTVTSLPACDLPFTAVFNNTSAITTVPPPPGLLDTYEWTYYDTDGTTVLAQNNFEDPIKIYNAYGIFPVKLKVTSVDGCVDSVYKPNAITITDNIADFTFPATGLCANANILFSDASSVGAIDWNWNFGDGSPAANIQNPFHSFSAAGTYNITLTTTFVDGCSEIITKPITILALPNADFTVTPVAPLCLTPMTFNFTPDVPGATYYWNFGDPSAAFGGESNLENSSWTYNSFGSYNVMMEITDANGCVNSFTDNITLSQPVADFDIIDIPNGCAPQNIEFLSTSTAVENIVTYNWYIDGVLQPTGNSDNPGLIFPVPGVFDVSLEIITINGCSDIYTDFGAIEIGSPPIINNILNDRDGCAVDAFSNGVNITVDAAAVPVVDSLFIDFGDGTDLWMFAPPFDVEHFFEATGNLIVSATAYNNGCAAVATNAGGGGINIDGPIANFVVNNAVGCNATSTLTFDNSASIDGVTPPTVYTWNFGDGTGDFVEPKGTAISHTYTAEGTYVVTLTATNAVSGCTNVESHTVNVTSSAPSFNISNPSPVCSSTPVVFNNTSTLVNIPDYTCEWDFGDGNVITTNNLNNVTHYYTPSLTPYNVTLTISHSGCSFTSASQAVTIHGPVANFTNPGTECDKAVMNFTNLSVSVQPVPSVLQYEWDFGDPLSASNLSNLTNPSHTFSGPGTYNVSLTVTDNNLPACTSTISRLVDILPSPTASFTTTRNKYCTNDPGPIQFTNSSTTPTGSLTYLWDFDNGATSTVPSPLYQYPADGIYDVNLTVTNTAGCTDNFVKTIETITPNLTVNVNGVVAATHNFTCPPATADFLVLPTPNSGFTAYNWTFGDGNTASIQNPSNVYVFPDHYNVHLVAVSDAGCNFDVLLSNFITVQGPKGTFTYNPDRICYPDVVNFDANNLRDFVTIEWDYGDGTGDVPPVTPAEIALLEAGGDVFGISQIPHNYTLPGVFNPFLILTDDQIPACKVYYPSTANPVYSSGYPEYADFTWTGGGEICEDVTFNFYDESIIDNYPTPAGPPLSPEIGDWDWTFYDIDGVTVLDFSNDQDPEYI